MGGKDEMNGLRFMVDYENVREAGGCGVGGFEVHNAGI